MKIKLAYALSGLLIITILFAMGINHSTNLGNLKPVGLKSDSVQPSSSTPPPRTDKNGAGTHKLESGPVTVLPWKNNTDFIAAQQENKTPVLMAAYHTVLHDPLPGEENNVHLGARILAGTVVKPGEVFSQNATVGPYSQTRGFQKGPVYLGSRLSTTIGGGVCKIASTLYNVTILSNLQIVERHSHGMPVPYVPYGQDATVSYGSKDFKFTNNTDYPILIWSQGIGNTLYIGFYGHEKPPAIEWHHKFLKKIQTYKIYRNNSSLPPDSEKTVAEGMDGAVVSSWITIQQNGLTRIKRLGKSYYSPMPYIIEKGTSTPASSTKR